MNIQQRISYETPLNTSVDAVPRIDDVIANAGWRIEEIIGGGKHLDFAKPFLPDTLAQTEALAFLDSFEQLTLNHIRSHGYLHAMARAEPLLASDKASSIRRYGQMFNGFRDEFECSFDTICGTANPPADFGARITAHHPLAINLMILHAEWMAQRHYMQSLEEAPGLDCRFTSLLRRRWMEATEQAELDAASARSIAAGMTARDIDATISEYFEIIVDLDTMLMDQVTYDLDALSRISGRRFNADEQREYQRVQRRAVRWTFFGSAMTHPDFLATVEGISPASRVKIQKIAPAFS